MSHAENTQSNIAINKNINKLGTSALWVVFIECKANERDYMITWALNKAEAEVDVTLVTRKR